MFKPSLFASIKRLWQLFKHRHVDVEQLVKSHSDMQEMLQMRSSLEELGLLAASIQHDVNNPLAVIESEIKRMKNKFQYDPEIMTHVERIEFQKMRIYEATKIIMFLRPQQDTSQKRLKINVHDFINHCIKDLKREVKTNNIVFKQSDTGSKKYYLSVHPPHIQQAITNILKNSVEAIHEAKRKTGIINIEARSDPTSTQLINIRISDNGCGLPNDFDFKSQGLFTTKADRKPNSGIGLFITNRIIEIYGGRMEFESKSGEGTSVNIFLPKAN
jgi:two-component system NtrC family sensor kinase